jgi:hypothetical protein
MNQFEFNYRNLRLRSCGKGLMVNGVEHDTAEIMQMSEKDDFKTGWVIAYYVKDGNGFYMKTVGDRIFDSRIEPERFMFVACKGLRLVNEMYGDME